MIKKIQFSTEEQKQQIISDNKNLILREEQYLFEGNYLIFADTPVMDEQLKTLNDDNLILMDALATTFEEVLNLQAQIGGTV